MNIYIFKNERTNKYGLPTYTEDTESLKTQIEDLYLQMKQKKEDEKIRKFKQENIYLAGEYDPNTGIITPKPIQKVIDIADTFDKYEELLLEEQYKDFLRKKNIEEKYKEQLKNAN